MQIKTSDEDTKYGVDPKDSFELVQHIIENCTSLQFSGLMTIGKSGDLTAFSTLYELRKQISEKFKLAEQDLELSMGMSADFEQAVSIQRCLEEIDISWIHVSLILISICTPRSLRVPQMCASGQRYSEHVTTRNELDTGVEEQE